MTRRLITLCFEADAPDGLVWGLRIGRRWHRAAHLVIDGVTLETVYRGLDARQPRAYLTGRGRVWWSRDTAVIQP